MGCKSHQLWVSTWKYFMGAIRGRWLWRPREEVLLSTLPTQYHLLFRRLLCQLYFWFIKPIHTSDVNRKKYVFLCFNYHVFCYCVGVSSLSVIQTWSSAFSLFNVFPSCFYFIESLFFICYYFWWSVALYDTLFFIILACLSWLFPTVSTHCKSHYFLPSTSNSFSSHFSAFIVTKFCPQACKSLVLDHKTLVFLHNSQFPWGMKREEACVVPGRGPGV